MITRRGSETVPDELLEDVSEGQTEPVAGLRAVPRAARVGGVRTTTRGLRVSV